MTEDYCSVCGSFKLDFNASDATDVKRALDRTVSGLVDTWGEEDRWWDRLTVVGKAVIVPGLGQVTLIHEEIPSPSDSYYGEFYQGYEGEAIRVIKVGDIFFKNTAPQDSYARVSWQEGELSRAAMKVKTIEVWE